MNPEVLGVQNNLFITFLASFLIWFMFAGLWLIWWIDGKFKQEQALHALISSIFAWIITQMIKSLIPTVRPFKINGFPPLTLTVPNDGAFPSGHSAAAFALAVTIYLHDKRLGALFILAALGVGAGRILGNVHFPLDILGGIVVGTLVAVAIDRLHVYKLLTKK
jgi:undecaprenyl-diphosphatase